MPAIIIFMAGVAILAVILLFAPDAILSLSVFQAGTGLSDAWQETVFTLILFGSILLIGAAGARWAKVASPLGTAPLGRFVSGMGLGFAGISIALAYAFIAGSAATGEGAELAGGKRAALLAGGCALILFQALAEEYYFRGWLQPVLARAWGEGLAVGATAFAFAALHFISGAESPWSLINLTLGGILFALLAAEGRGIAGATGAHFAWNASEQLLFGLDPNPGTGTFGAIIDLDLGGSPLWGGSAEGLNASLPMSMALAVILVPLLIVRCRRRTVAKAAAPG